jgi:hypothetical protein
VTVADVSSAEREAIAAKIHAALDGFVIRHTVAWG